MVEANRGVPRHQEFFTGYVGEPRPLRTAGSGNYCDLTHEQPPFNGGCGGGTLPVILRNSRNSNYRNSPPTDSRRFSCSNRWVELGGVVRDVLAAIADQNGSAAADCLRVELLQLSQAAGVARRAAVKSAQARFARAAQEARSQNVHYGNVVTLRLLAAASRRHRSVTSPQTFTRSLDLEQPALERQSQNDHPWDARAEGAQEGPAGRQDRRSPQDGPDGRQNADRAAEAPWSRVARVCDQARSWRGE